MAAGSPKIDELRARLQSDPKSRMFLPLAEELRKAGRLAEAEKVLRDGIASHPSYLSAWVSLGRVLLLMGNPGAAAEAANRALKLDPENIVAARVCADAYYSSGDKVEAIKKYKLVHAFLPTDLEVQARIEELDREVNPDRQSRPIPLSTTDASEFNVLEESAPLHLEDETDHVETRTMPLVTMPYDELAPGAPPVESRPFAAAPPESSGADPLARETESFLQAAFAPQQDDDEGEDTLSKRTSAPEPAVADATAPEAPPADLAWVPLQGLIEEDSSADTFEELAEPTVVEAEPSPAFETSSESAAAPVAEPFERTDLPPEEPFAAEQPADTDRPYASLTEPPREILALAETQYVQPLPEHEPESRATIARLEGWLRVIRKVDE